MLHALFISIFREMINNSHKMLASSIVNSQELQFIIINYLNPALFITMSLTTEMYFTLQICRDANLQDDENLENLKYNFLNSARHFKKCMEIEAHIVRIA